MSWCCDLKTQCVCTTIAERVFGDIPLCRALALTAALHGAVGCRGHGFRGMRLGAVLDSTGSLGLGFGRGLQLWSAGSGAVLLSLCCIPPQGRFLGAGGREKDGIPNAHFVEGSGAACPSVCPCGVHRAWLAGTGTSSRGCWWSPGHKDGDRQCQLGFVLFAQGLEVPWGAGAHCCWAEMHC